METWAWVSSWGQQQRELKAGRAAKVRDGCGNLVSCAPGCGQAPFQTGHGGVCRTLSCPSAVVCMFLHPLELRVSPAGSRRPGQPVYSGPGRPCHGRFSALSPLGFVVPGPVLGEVGRQRECSLGETMSLPRWGGPGPRYAAAPDPSLHLRPTQQVCELLLPH